MVCAGDPEQFHIRVRAQFDEKRCGSLTSGIIRDASIRRNVTEEMNDIITSADGPKESLGIGENLLCWGGVKLGVAMSISTRRFCEFSAQASDKDLSTDYFILCAFLEEVTESQATRTIRRIVGSSSLASTNS